jgi:hypothetical protein
MKNADILDDWYTNAGKASNAALAQVMVKLSPIDDTGYIS